MFKAIVGFLLGRGSVAPAPVILERRSLKPVPKGAKLTQGECPCGASRAEWTWSIGVTSYYRVVCSSCLSWSDGSSR